jgi:hypothetical protein
VALQEEEAADAIHAQENIGYFFWGAGTGGVPVTGAALSAGIQPLRTGRSGVSPTAAWYYYIVEEKSKDAETWHGWETLGCLTFSGTPLGQPPYILDLQTCNGADPCTLRLAYLTTAGAARTLSGAQALGLPGSGLYGLLVRAQSEGGAELRAVEIAVGEAVAEGLPLARACKPGETVALSAPMSIADAPRLLAFSHWEVDGVPAELGQATIQVEMTSDREAVAFYVLGN